METFSFILTILVEGVHCLFEEVVGDVIEGGDFGYWDISISLVCLCVSCREVERFVSLYG